MQKILDKFNSLLDNYISNSNNFAVKPEFVYINHFDNETFIINKNNWFIAGKKISIDKLKLNSIYIHENIFTLAGAIESFVLANFLSKEEASIIYSNYLAKVEKYNLTLLKLLLALEKLGYKARKLT